MFFGGGFPFPGGFPGGGFEGHPGAGNGARRGGGKVDNEKFYKLLGVSKDASGDEIRKAYRKLALKEHPDKGGDAEKFKAATLAYEVLSDPTKRAVYDESGEEGLEGAGGGHSGMDATDVFAELFGGGGGGGGGRGRRRAKDIVHPLEVSLEQLYTGRTVKLAVTRDATCSGCSGSGCVGGASESDCGTCRGRGMVMQVRQLGPGMISQSSAPCTACKGSGRVVPEGKKCRTCAGAKTVKERKQVEVHVEPGMRNGSRIVFKGEAGGTPGLEAGDIVFVVQVKEHAYLKRDGNDLFLEKEIPLVEALTGVDFTVGHLDGRTLRVVSGPGEVINPGAFKLLPGCGMPLPHTAGMRHGDMYIRFTVLFPPSGSLSLPALAALRGALPAASPTTNGKKHNHVRARAMDAEGDAMEEDGGVEEVRMLDASAESRAARVAEQKAASGRPGEAYDSEEEDNGRGGAQRVQCAQQ